MGVFFARFQVEAQLEKVTTELDVQSQHTARLESGCRALERSLGQSCKRLQVGCPGRTVKHFHIRRGDDCLRKNARWGGVRKSPILSRRSGTVQI